MKNVLFLLCIVPFVWLAANDSMAFAQTMDYYSIVQVHDLSPEHWNETVMTDQGETIVFDCPVVVPDVQSLPVIQVRPMEKRSDAVEAQYTVDAVYRSYMDAYTDTGKHCLAFENHPGNFYYGKHGFDAYMKKYFWTDKYDYASEFLPYESADLNVIYPKNSTITLDEAIRIYQQWISTFFPDEQISMRLSPVKPSTYRSAFFDTHDRHEITPCGAYELSFDQVIHGIPILLPISQIFNQSIKSRAEETLSVCRGSGSLTLAATDVEFGIQASLCQELMIAESDVPVIGFETVRNLLKEEVRSGRLRKITRIELGYCVYTDAESSDFCWLVPAWICRGTFDAENHELMVISGQHGELMSNPAKTDSERSVRPTVVLW